MKFLLSSLSLVLLLAQIPFFPQEPEKSKGEESPVKGWKLAAYFGVPPTQYSKAGKGIIKAESVWSRSSLFKTVEEKEKNLPLLTWGWKVSNVVRSAIETRKDRFDAAARVIVIFWKERTYGIFGRGEPVELKIEYIWATRLPEGHIFDHPTQKNCKVFVLESGNGKASQWVYYKRNIHRDYKKAFGKEPEGVLVVGSKPTPITATK